MDGVLKEIIEQLKVLHLFYCLIKKCLCFFTEKVFMNGNQSVLNRFSTSGWNPPRPGSWYFYRGIGWFKALVEKLFTTHWLIPFIYEGFMSAMAKVWICSWVDGMLYSSRRKPSFKEWLSATTTFNLTDKSPVHTFCKRKFGAILMWIWRHNSVSTAIFARELSPSQLLRIICCEFLISTFILHSHLQEVWSTLLLFLPIRMKWTLLFFSFFFPFHFVSREV